MPQPSCLIQLNIHLDLTFGQPKREGGKWVGAERLASCLPFPPEIGLSGSLGPLPRSMWARHCVSHDCHGYY